MRITLASMRKIVRGTPRDKEVQAIISKNTPPSPTSAIAPTKTPAPTQAPKGF